MVENLPGTIQGIDEELQILSEFINMNDRNFHEDIELRKRADELLDQRIELMVAIAVLKTSNKISKLYKL